VKNVGLGEARRTRKRTCIKGFASCASPQGQEKKENDLFLLKGRGGEEGKAYGSKKEGEKDLTSQSRSREKVVISRPVKDRGGKNTIGKGGSTGGGTGIPRRKRVR